MNNKDMYTLDEVIRVLEQCRKDGSVNFNFPKAIYCLALEIKKLRDKPSFEEETEICISKYSIDLSDHLEEDESDDPKSSA